MKKENWPAKRRRLLVALVVLVSLLVGVYFLQAFLVHRDGFSPLLDLETEAESLLPPADAEEAEALMIKELEAGLENKEPGLMAFVFRGSAVESEEECGWFCLDLPVAEGLEVHLISPEGKTCKATTGTAIIWRSDAFSFPATPLKPVGECALPATTDLAVFTASPPAFEKLDLRKAISESEAERHRFAQDRPLRTRLIEESAVSEGTVPLTESITPLPPEIMTLDTAEGPVTLKTQRWSDGGGEARRGPTDFETVGQPSKRVADTGLFCSEVPGAFKLDGAVYIEMREGGCDSGLSCRGILRWEKNRFEMVYGTCNFST